jgi:hypothetical protein
MKCFLTLSNEIVEMPPDAKFLKKSRSGVSIWISDQSRPQLAKYLIKLAPLNN